MSINTARLIKNNKGADKISIPILLGIMSASIFSSNVHADELTYLEELGKRLFFEDISLNNNMSCSTCHTGTTGGTNGDSVTNDTDVAVTGSDNVSVGNLKPPTNQYAQFLNEQFEVEGLINFDPNCPAFGGPAPCGGAFWNGRAEGDLIETFHNIDPFAGVGSEYEGMYRKYLGPLSDQAHASPFINPVEQALATKQDACKQVRDDTIWGGQLYQYAWGTELKCGKRQIDKTFARFAIALSAWQMSKENNSFDSKRDNALKSDANGQFPLDGFTAKENHGHDLFYGLAGPGVDRPGGFGGARCFFCHRSDTTNLGEGETERYTNDQYFNIGVPRNHNIPGDPSPDIGLEAITGNPGHRGEHKVPTLRNVDKRPHAGFVKAYTHNGYFKSLEQLVHFYNTATAKAQCAPHITEVDDAIANNCWPAPEIADNFAGFGVGNLGLTPTEEAAVVSYLKTFSDESSVQAPSRYRLHIINESRLDHGDDGSSSGPFGGLEDRARDAFGSF